jgi:hypothetical protein
VGDPTGDHHVAALDQHGRDLAGAEHPRRLADGDAHEQLVEARLPGVGRELGGQAPTRAVGAVEPPSDVGVADPAVEQREVVGHQAETAAQDRG